MSYTVADLIAEILERCGIETAFGVISVHNIPMLDAISRRNRIRFVMARGELGAGHMADGYARAGGRLGLVVTSTGPGAANACAPLVEARFAGAPVLHITGQVPTRFIGRDCGTTHEVIDQAGMLASVSKAAFTVKTPGEAMGVFAEAVRVALSPRMGPVSVDVPIDVQKAEIQRPAALETFAPQPVVPPAPDEAALDQLARRVLEAKRPMLWLGNGAKAAGAEVLRLLEMGFGMVSSWNGRGTVPEDHPMSLCGLNGSGLPMVEDFYRTVDLMLIAGSRVRGHETAEFSVKLPDNRVQIDIDPRADGRTYSNELFVVGDAGAVLGGLADRIEGKLQIDPAYPEEVRRLKGVTRRAFAATLGPYQTFAEQLRAVMPRDAIWARDVTINHSTWGNRLFEVYDPTTSIYPVGAGIGQGLSLGLGAAMADGRKTVVMTGDGGFHLNLGELWTAIQENLDVTILVMNDNGYGVIRHIQDAVVGGRRRNETLAQPDLAELAKVAGLPFWRVSEPEAFGATVAKALAVTGPTLVEVDMVAIGPHPPYYPYGPKAEVLEEDRG